MLEHPDNMLTVLPNLTNPFVIFSIILYFHLRYFWNTLYFKKKLFKILNISWFLLLQTRTARAVFQFYPENEEQIDLITAQAMKAGFYGGLVVDYPNSAKAKKYFLVLMTGGSMPLPKALDDGDVNPVHVQFTSRRWVQPTIFET